MRLARLPASRAAFTAMPEPTIEALPTGEVTHSWCVEISWPSGKTERVTGFFNQYHAVEWVRRESANWLADRVMNDPTLVD